MLPCIVFFVALVLTGGYINALIMDIILACKEITRKGSVWISFVHLIIVCAMWAWLFYLLH